MQVGIPAPPQPGYCGFRLTLCFVAELHCTIWPWQCKAGQASSEQGEDPSKNDGFWLDRESCE